MKLRTKLKYAWTFVRGEPVVYVGAQKVELSTDKVSLKLALFIDCGPSDPEDEAILVIGAKADD